MKFKLLITAIALSLMMPAAAEFTTKVSAHEVALSTLRLPESEAGTIGFKACDGCDYQTTRVTSDTRWEVNKKPVTLKKFKETLTKLDDRNSASIVVLHHLALNQITRVSVTIL